MDGKIVLGIILGFLFLIVVFVVSETEQPKKTEQIKTNDKILPSFGKKEKEENEAKTYYKNFIKSLNKKKEQENNFYKDLREKNLLNPIPFSKKLSLNVKTNNPNFVPCNTSIIPLNSSHSSNSFKNFNQHEKNDKNEKETENEKREKEKENKILGITRCINWFDNRIQGRGDHILENKNIVFIFDLKNDKIENQYPLIDKTKSRYFNKKTGWIGIEDARLFSISPDNSQIKFSCTTYEHEGGPNSQIAVGQADFNDSEQTWDIVHFWFLERKAAKEKNWLFFEPAFFSETNYEAIYHWFPSFEIIHLDLQPFEKENLILQENEKEKEKEKDIKSKTIIKKQYDILSRGSCGPIQFPLESNKAVLNKEALNKEKQEIGYLILTHESEDGISGVQSLRYYHRFYWMDQERNLKLKSDLFYFDDFQIEYCCGMLFNSQINQLVLSYSVLDRYPFFKFIDLSIILNMLKSF